MQERVNFSLFLVLIILFSEVLCMLRIVRLLSVYSAFIVRLLCGAYRIPQEVGGVKKDEKIVWDLRM